MKRLLPLTGLVVLVGFAGALAGEKGTPEDAKALLDKAVTLVQVEGEEKAIATFNDQQGGFIKGDLYVFCMDADNKVTAHIDSKMLGTDVATLVDPDGNPVGKQMVEVAKKGEGSLEYKWMNPASKKVESKVSFLKKAGSQVCGVGAYK